MTKHEKYTEMPFAKEIRDQYAMEIHQVFKDGPRDGITVVELVDRKDIRPPREVFVRKDTHPPQSEKPMKLEAVVSFLSYGRKESFIHPATSQKIIVAPDVGNGLEVYLGGHLEAYLPLHGWEEETPKIKTFNWNRACQLLEDGKKVSRLIWSPNVYLHLNAAGYVEEVAFGKSSYLSLSVEYMRAEDWHELEE